MANVTDPALTYTLDDFISMKVTDEVTFHNFSIVEVVDSIELLDHNVIEDYFTELNSLCATVPLTDEQYKKYKYAPDLLAYDVYGSTQLDFLVLYVNDMIDFKEFDRKTIQLPYASALKAFLSEVYNTESGYIQQNRADNGLTSYIY